MYFLKWPISTLIIALFTPILINAQTFDTEKALQSDKTTYNIGDIGPAGGVIFFNKGFIADGWQYLEVSPADTVLHIQWGAYEKDVKGTSTSVGSGKKNTQIIVEHMKQFGERNSAALICANMNINGYADWFLPSKDELDLLYKNLKQKGLGDFDDSWYWSSSQYNIYYAWFQRFSDGKQDYAGGGTKYMKFDIRAIRAF